MEKDTLWIKASMSDFNELYPKPRTGKECKKTDCDRHKNYVAWQFGTSSLSFCMECKHAHVSQYKRKVTNAVLSGKPQHTEL